jgi:putative transposase
MPRGPRIDEPGMFHHVMLRGIEKRRIFLDDIDRRAVVAPVAQAVQKRETHCLCWALLANHVHLVMRTGRIPLARTMAGLNTAYAAHFNRRHDRVGHLFQNRYRSRPIDDDADLQRVILYVAGNPLKDGVVTSEEALGRHPWAAYGALIGSAAAQPFHAVPEALKAFGDSPASARQEARRHLRDRLARWRAVADPGDQRPEAEERHTVGLDHLITETCLEFGVSQSALSAGRRTTDLSNARAAVARIGLVRKYPPSAIASRLGVSVSALHKAARRTPDARGGKVHGSGTSPYSSAAGR